MICLEVDSADPCKRDKVMGYKHYYLPMEMGLTIIYNMPQFNNKGLEQWNGIDWKNDAFKGQHLCVLCQHYA